jgi:hypothetical protein
LERLLLLLFSQLGLLQAQVPERSAMKLSLPKTILMPDCIFSGSSPKSKTIPI